MKMRIVQEYVVVIVAGKENIIYKYKNIILIYTVYILYINKM